MKKILIITQHVPTPTSQHGVFKRLGTFLEAINENYVIDFLFYIWPNQTFDHDELRVMIRKIWDVDANLILTCPIRVKHAGDDLWNDYLLPAINISENPIYFRLSGDQQVNAIESYLSNERPDALFAHRLSSMCPLLKCKVKLPPIYFDLDDIEHVSFLRGIRNLPKRLKNYFLYLQLPSLMLLERKAIQFSKKCFVCSMSDKKYLSRLYISQKIAVVPNSVSIPEIVTIPGNEQSVLFLGTYTYQPNIDAAEDLITKIWPRIINRLPFATLYIAGKNHELIPSFSGVHSNVVFTGFVESLDDLYARVGVVCCPIYVAGGTRIKILEAAVYGKAIVSTRIGAEGIELVDKKEIIINDDVEGLADACVNLLSDTNLIKEIGSNARMKISNTYNRNRIVRLINALLS
jgi:glycosyltransferase involved in cell wall biosynthesis